MKLALPFAFVVLFGAATPTFAQSAFDGTWKIDLASAQLPDRPYVQSLENGTYACSSCVPTYTIPADGAFHEVEGFPYMDEVSIRIVDDHTVEEAQKLNDRPMGASRSTVSTDGATLTTTWTDTSAPNGEAATGESTMTRIASGASGAHAISGSWKNASVSNVSDDSLIATMTLADDVFTLSMPSGYAYEARLGGPPVPVVGDPANATASVRQLADGSIEVTDWIDGKAVSVLTITPAADGASMTLKSENKKVGTTTTYTIVKQ